MNRKIKTKTRHQKGQAIMEMCVCLIPILVVFLGMIVISGLGISNIQAFIEAKASAEIASRNSNAVGGAGETIHSWDYGDPTQDGDGLPFTADDQPVNFSQVNAERNTQAIANIQLNMINDSQSMEPDAPNNGNQYIFVPTSWISTSDNNYAGDIPDTMLAAAALVSGTANSNLHTVFTLGADNDETRKITPAFTALFGINLEDIDLASMKANKVYYPAMPTTVITNGVDQ